MGLDLTFLNALSDTIEGRKSGDPSASYVSKLFNKGGAKMGAKVGEEGVEFAQEMMRDNDEKLLDEGADLLLHMMVALSSREYTLEDVVKVLVAREGVGGIAEKVSRSKPADPNPSP